MKLTVRGRLTLVFGGLFLVAGLVLLGATYVLVSHRDPGLNLLVDVQPPAGAMPTPAPTGPAPGPTMRIGPQDDGAFAKQLVRGTQAESLHALLTQGLIALAVVTAAATALGWLIAGRMLQPLHRITDTARRIADSPHSLHERIALDGPRDEVTELADTFDLMLSRLDHSFDSQKRFIANASHELRTPLTLNRTLVEVAMSDAGAPPAVHQLGTTLLAVNDRHDRLIEGLLVLAQSERQVTERSYVDLADIAVHVGGGTKISAEPAPVLGDPVLLEHLVRNLVENGFRHNVPVGGWVSVTTRTAGPRAVLTVSNTGPVISGYEVPTLFEPFRRLKGDRLAGPGAGLGLSIVRAVTRAHDGEVHAEPRDGGGLIVTVTLPAAP